MVQAELISSSKETVINTVVPGHVVCKICVVLDQTALHVFSFVCVFTLNYWVVLIRRENYFTGGR